MRRLGTGNPDTKWSPARRNRRPGRPKESSALDLPKLLFRVTLVTFVPVVAGDDVAKIKEARLYPRGCFSVSDWTCRTGTHT